MTKYIVEEINRLTDPVRKGEITIEDLTVYILRSAERSTKMVIVRYLSTQLRIPRKSIEKYLDYLVNIGVLVIDKDRPRTNNRAIYYKPA